MRIARYLASNVLKRSAAAFALFIVVYSAIDFVEMGSRLEAGAGEAALGGLHLLRLYPLRLPMIAAHILPLSMMVGVQTTLASLRRRGEWDSLRAAGFAPRTTALALLLVPLIGAVLSWALLSELSPRALGLWGSRLGGDTVESAQRWCKRGQVLNREPGRGETAFTIERDSAGAPVAFSARSLGRTASWTDGAGWMLKPLTMSFPECGPKNGQATSLLFGLDGASLTSKELDAEIVRSEKRGWDAAPLRAEAALREAIAAACLMVPLVGLGLGLGREESRATRLVAQGIAAAVAFWLIMAAAWNGAAVGAWSPLWISVATPLLFLAMGLVALLFFGRR